MQNTQEWRSVLCEIIQDVHPESSPMGQDMLFDTVVAVVQNQVTFVPSIGSHNISTVTNIMCEAQVIANKLMVDFDKSDINT